MWGHIKKKELISWGNNKKTGNMMTQYNDNAYHLFDDQIWMEKRSQKRVTQAGNAKKGTVIVKPLFISFLGLN